MVVNAMQKSLRSTVQTSLVLLNTVSTLGQNGRLVLNAMFLKLMKTQKR